MKNEIKVEKQIKLVENFYGWQLKEFQRDHLRKLFRDLESSSGFSDDNLPDRGLLLISH